MNITNRLVFLMNGKIDVQSIPGEGSVFTVRLPQKRIGTAVCGADLTERMRNFRFLEATISKKVLFLREYMPYGRVLVVDDVISNIYVTKGMLQPYGLNIDTVSSGFEAIDRVKNGNEYDIIFMDHMMPMMDGIEAVKIIRETGYKHYIVALTANALIGQEEMFLRNGFDGFISKPIDSRELNLLLNEFIRNKKPLEIVESARRELHEKSQTKTSKTDEDSQIESLFILDAEDAVKVLEKLYQKIHELSEKEISSFIITVHGIKSALANVGHKELSAVALRLEKAGDERNYAVMSEETPVLVNALKSLINKNKSAKEESNDNSGNEIISEKDRLFLREKLSEIKTACAEFDRNAANTALDILKQKNWPHHIDAVLGKITLNIFHSAFKKAADTAEETAAGL